MNQYYKVLSYASSATVFYSVFTVYYILRYHIISYSTLNICICIYIYVYVYTVLNNTILSYTILISQFLFHSTLFHSVLLRYIMFITGSLHCGMLHDTAWSGLIFCYIKAFYIHMHTHKYICICIIYIYTCSLATDWPTDRPTYSHTHMIPVPLSTSLLL